MDVNKIGTNKYNSVEDQIQSCSRGDDLLESELSLDLLDGLLDEDCDTSISEQPQKVIPSSEANHTVALPPQWHGNTYADYRNITNDQQTQQFSNPDYTYYNQQTLYGTVVPHARQTNTRHMSQTVPLQGHVIPTTIQPPQQRKYGKQQQTSQGVFSSGQSSGELAASATAQPSIDTQTGSGKPSTSGSHSVRDTSTTNEQMCLSNNYQSVQPSSGSENAGDGEDGKAAAKSAKQTALKQRRVENSRRHRREKKAELENAQERCKQLEKKCADLEGENKLLMQKLCSVTEELNSVLKSQAKGSVGTQNIQGVNRPCNVLPENNYFTATDPNQPVDNLLPHQPMWMSGVQQQAQSSLQSGYNMLPQQNAAPNGLIGGMADYSGFVTQQEAAYQFMGSGMQQQADCLIGKRLREHTTLDAVTAPATGACDTECKRTKRKLPSKVTISRGNGFIPISGMSLIGMMACICLVVMVITSNFSMYGSTTYRSAIGNAGMPTYGPLVQRSSRSLLSLPSSPSDPFYAFDTTPVHHTAMQVVQKPLAKQDRENALSKLQLQLGPAGKMSHAQLDAPQNRAGLIQVMTAGSDNQTLNSESLETLKHSSQSISGQQVSRQTDRRNKNSDEVAFTKFASHVGASGVIHPKRCVRVYSFDSEEGNQVPHLRKQMLGWRNSSPGMRQGAIPLPDQSDGNSVGEELWGSLDKDVVVSVYFPVQDSVRQSSQFTLLDHLYVVAFKPNQKFEAFKCDLPTSVFL